MLNGDIIAYKLYYNKGKYLGICFLIFSSVFWIIPLLISDTIFGTLIKPSFYPIYVKLFFFIVYFILTAVVYFGFIIALHFLAFEEISIKKSIDLMKQGVKTYVEKNSLFSGRRYTTNEYIIFIRIKRKKNSLFSDEVIPWSIKEIIYIIVSIYILMAFIFSIIVMLTTRGDILIQLSFSFSFSSGAIILILSFVSTMFFSRKELMKTRNKTYQEIKKKYQYFKGDISEIIMFIQKELFID